MVTGFVYIWRNNINLKWYLGSHKGHQDDGYIGSGKVFKIALKKYGIENFTRHIVYEGEDFRLVEEEMLMLLDAADDMRCYNLKNHARGGGHKRAHSSETKAKISASQKGRKRLTPKSAETRAKISAIHKGKTISEEHKAKISAARKKEKRGPPSAETREKMRAGNLGKIMSPEARAKISATKKGVPWSNEERIKREEMKKIRINNKEI